jgi:hypothetical protein
MCLCLVGIVIYEPCHLSTMLCMNLNCVLYELCHLCAMWFMNYFMYDMCVV